MPLSKASSLLCWGYFFLQCFESEPNIAGILASRVTQTQNLNPNLSTLSMKTPPDGASRQAQIQDREDGG